MDGGSIVTYTIQSDILEIANYMKNAGLAFCRIIPIVLAGPFPRAYHKRIVITWKPLLWFTKGTRDVRVYDYMRDSIVIVSEPIGDRKDYHEWAQSPTEALEIISRLTFENQIVLDPMMDSNYWNRCTKGQTKICGGRKRPRELRSSKSTIGQMACKKAIENQQALTIVIGDEQ